jgi:hypothetical protein
VEVTRALLQAGADLCRSSNTGRTHLAAARAKNHEEAVLALVEAGATWQSDVRVATYLSQIERLHRTVDLSMQLGCGSLSQHLLWHTRS